MTVQARAPSSAVGGSRTLDSAGAITGVATSVAAFVGRAPAGPVGTPVTVASVVEFESVFGPLCPDGSLGFAVRDFFANGGSEAVILRLFAPDWTGDPSGAPLTASDVVGPGLKADGAGLYALDRVDVVNLLVVVPDAPDGVVDPAVVRGAAAYCRERRAVLLLDGLPTWSSAADVLADCATGLDTVIGTSSANAAVFHPRLRQPNPMRGNAVEDFSAIGAVAGVIARTDARAGVWSPPAGQQALLNRVPALSSDLTSREVSAVTAAGVNCLRSIPGGGRVVWGARTMQGADSAGSDWKYLSVRRTALFIQESVSRGTQWVQYEPNAEATWAVVREHVADFMHTLFAAGAFPATSMESDAYVVACGPDTMDQDDIDDGVLVIQVGFAPIRAGEFVVVRLRQAMGSRR